MFLGGYATLLFATFYSPLPVLTYLGANCGHNWNGKGQEHQ